MAHEDKENNTTSEPTSPQSISTEILTMILLLVGTIIIEAIKDNFGKSLPLILVITLFLIEITSALYFVAKLIRASRTVFKEFDDFVLLFKSSNTLQVIRQFKQINFKAISWETALKQLGIALLIAFFIFILLVLFININAISKFFFSDVLPNSNRIVGLISISLTALSSVTKIFSQSREKSEEKKK